LSGIDDFHFLFHSKSIILCSFSASVYSLNPCTPTKSSPYFVNSLAAVLSNLTCKNVYVRSSKFKLSFVPLRLLQITCPSQCSYEIFRNMIVFPRRMKPLAQPASQKYSLSTVGDCLLHIFTAIAGILPQRRRQFEGQPSSRVPLSLRSSYLRQMVATTT
jgi:hypothetical protein